MAEAIEDVAFLMAKMRAENRSCTNLRAEHAKVLATGEKFSWMMLVVQNGMVITATTPSGRHVERLALTDQGWALSRDNLIIAKEPANF